MSQLNDIVERIAAIQIGIEVPGLGRPQVLASNPYQPSDVSSVQCPFWINEIRGGESDLPISGGNQYRTTNIDMLLAVQRRIGNVNLKYGVKETAEWVDAVYSAFARHIKLSLPSVKIKSSTNANPITVTTAVPHNFSAGEQVIVSGHLINTNANGTWNIGVTDYEKFTIPTAGNGVGAASGQAVKVQPYDLANVNDAVITRWDLVPYIYGTGVDENEPNFLALRFGLRVREIYVQTMSI